MAISHGLACAVNMVSPSFLAPATVHALHVPGNVILGGSGVLAYSFPAWLHLLI